MEAHKSINKIDYSIAFTTGSGKIYINRNLETFNKELYDKVLMHELSHQPGPYNTQDLEEDLSIDYFPLTEKIRFCLKHPKGFASFLPVIITKDEVCVSWLGIFKWLIIIGLIILSFWWLI
jgi:hypothetical protein